MKRLLIVLLVITVLFIIGCGDDNPVNNNNNNNNNDPFNIVFNTGVGGTDWEWGRDIVAVPSGGYVVTGWTDSYGQGRNDLYLIRVNADGDVLWESNFGGTQNNSDDIGEGVALTADGNIIATGVSNAFGSNYQRYIVKVDMDGNLIWETTIGEGTYESTSKIFPVTDGYIVGGNEGVYPDEVFYIMKIDLSGNLVWDSVFNSIDEEFRCMTPTSDNGFVLAGEYILKVDQNGVPQWSDSTDADIYSVIEASDGSIYGSGNQFSNGIFTYDDSVYVVKYSGNGALQWEQTYEFRGTGLINENTDGTLSIAYWNLISHEIYIATIDATGDVLTNLETGVNGILYDFILSNSGFVFTGYDVYTDPNGNVFIAEVEEN